MGGGVKDVNGGEVLENTIIHQIIEDDVYRAN